MTALTEALRNDWTYFWPKDRRHRWAVRLSQRDKATCLAYCVTCGKQQRIANLAVTRKALFRSTLGFIDNVTFVEWGE